MKILQKLIDDNNIKTYIEPFCGGCNVIDEIKCDKCGTVSPIGTKFCIKCGDAFVVCPACKKDNPSQTKFCIFCGSPMKLVCKNCGTEYIAGAVFCGECGQKL